MFRYLHICLHQKLDNTVQEATMTIKVVNNKTNIDMLIKAASVLEIEEVRVLEYTPRPDLEQLTYDEEGQILDNPTFEKGYYDPEFYYFQNYEKFFEEDATISEPIPVKFYSVYLKNRIQWHVEPPLVYEVKVKVRYDKKTTRFLELSDCEICQGRGWYVDILNNKGQFEKDVGTIKIVQRILKDFLTELSTSSLNLNYGTLIRKTVAKGNIDDEVLFEDIRLILSEVEQSYYQRQIEEYDRLTPDERLVSLDIERLERNSKNRAIIQMDLKITTEADSRLFRLGM